MRHVTDGELHAYLDGALDALSAERAEEVRAHLGSCSACKERLQDEERVRDRAQSLLSGVAPSDVAPPPFEAIRELATAGDQPAESPGKGGSILPDRRWKPLKGLPLAWAATIVLALGVGWMGGRVWRSLPQDTRIPVTPRPSEALVSEPRQRPDAGERAEAQEAPGDLPAAERLRSENADLEAAVPSEAVVGGVAASLLNEQSREEEGRAAEETDQQSASTPPVVESLRIQKLAAEERLDSIAPTLRDLRRAEPAEAIAMPVAADVSEGIPGDTIALEGAMADPEGFGSTLAVPGLEVLSMEWEEWIPGERGLNIRQLLPSGDTLELRYLGMLVGREPERREKAAMKVPEPAAERPPSLKGLEASLPPGWNQVTMRWGRGWLVARAPIPQETIRGLLRSIF